ncbi:putative receptor protein kinase ZmPK1 [Corylus avellana]|uniref:putative receptor protein kinase ZmPK1 n=1 Tax=Corylus avellana TaxID=13451 RepID=UPI001E23B0F1|nr:putative receptor protein kinase ZmPK1 [Corylus avellana]
MDLSSFILLFFLLQIPYPCSSVTYDYLLKGSFLSVEKPSDVLVSANGDFCAGFFSVGENAFSFSVWFTKSSNPTVVWMANRDQPVNGKASRLSLLEDGNLILSDAGRVTIWTTTTASASSLQLQLLNTGNLVLRTSDSVFLWQSFDSPTDTLLPQQLLTLDASLISSRSQSNYSSGYYKLYFDNDNVLRLLYNGPNISSVYWPDPWLLSWEAGRTTYNISKTAVLNVTGHFSSSDDLEFKAADFGMVVKRRLTLDPDGNIRLYSLDEFLKTWVVTWQAIMEPCRVNGVCGPNSLCSYNHVWGRTCSCIQGYKLQNPNGWSTGCESEFKISCNSSQFHFVMVSNVEFYGYDKNYKQNSTLQECEEECLKMCDDCKGFQFKFDTGTGVYSCYPKALLLNGHHTPDFDGDVYLKLPKADISSDKEEVMLDCHGEVRQLLSRTYKNGHENRSLKFLVWFASALGCVELTCFLLVWCFLFWGRKNPDKALQGYILAAAGFRKFSYAELKKATRGFSEEIGRGGGGVVYKGVLSDHRVAAIKRLNEAAQGEAEFMGEVSSIGRLNHMNLIEMWGYCAEGKQRLLVYEYMERGSLADNLSSATLNWEKRFEIALGTAKGLAYLHEECLEWILHCDIKPQNILLDSNFRPKVADFGLSKLLNRGGSDNMTSRIRGTRGYMAPEWVYNLPITSKVDVYSYGIVVLEMVTGKSQTNILTVDGGGVIEQGGVVTWVRDKVKKAATRKESRIEEIVDPMMAGKYEMGKMEVVIRVALQCVEEDKDARPTMRQVVEMLLRWEDEHSMTF